MADCGRGNADDADLARIGLPKADRRGLGLVEFELNVIYAAYLC
jgi:hypothetical protein